ncbi:HNH endonuclease [Faecalispora anaeroviscerum]|uniref:HNH endonuclease n=1 Tax=Faecalispora anaeroviscerum TaxID=2991836 RepID=UPI0024BAABCF|nr:HNH endonuclease [Faecalispora anaeroviscerum]
MHSGEIRYLTKKLLIEFNMASIREKRNRNIREDYLESLPEKYYPVKFIMIHNTLHEVRTMVIFDDKGTSAFLDMSTERYETIPVALEDSDGKYLVLEEADIREKMPYDGKEYTEKVYKKPYRKPSFRKKILNIYNNRCAVCGNNNVDVLRAAHIKDAASGGIEEPCNGICLCANHEIAFDRGTLKIKPDGEIISLVEDITIEAAYIEYPESEDNWPSKELLKWKYEKANNN